MSGFLFGERRPVGARVEIFCGLDKQMFIYVYVIESCC